MERHIFENRMNRILDNPYQSYTCFSIRNNFGIEALNFYIALFKPRETAKDNSVWLEHPYNNASDLELSEEQVKMYRVKLLKQFKNLILSTKYYEDM